MSSIAFEAASAVYDEAAAVLDKLQDLDVEALSAAEPLELLARNETITRRLPALQHPSISWLAEHGTVAELGGSVRDALADGLRITRGDAAPRIGQAAGLGPRRTPTGPRAA